MAALKNHLPKSTFCTRRRRPIPGSKSGQDTVSLRKFPSLLTVIFSLLLSLAALPLSEALNVLVVGGSGRVGGSTVRWLRTLTERENERASITVGGRRRESYEVARRRNVIPSDGSVDFLELDIDGDAEKLRSTVAKWKESCHSQISNGGDDGKGSEDGKFLVVHTAGPFQGRRDPALLRTCVELRMPYVDVCDEWDLAEASKETLSEIAADAKVPAVVACGIWPGVSALMAAEASRKLEKETGEACDTVDFSFFTAGTGNAGPTIVSATFLLLATPAITFEGGKRVDVEPWTDSRTVDFGPGVGMRPVWLLDNPDVPTTAAALGVKRTSSRFGTAPLFWNYLFGAMKALPRSLLYNRDAMMAFSLFSEPIIRFVDRLVGATNAMRVDAKNADGTKCVTSRIAHPDLEQCVGLATAAFALELLKGTVPPGVWFPAEIPTEARANILEIAKEDAIVYEV